MAHDIFISYRKSISGNEADFLQLKLEEHFGKGSAFLDKHDIQVGDDWEHTLKSKLDDAKVVLIIIGKNWTTSAWDITDAGKGIYKGQRRIDHPKDWVCREIQEAYRAKKAVVVYMAGARPGEVNPSDITNPKFPDVKVFFEKSQQKIAISAQRSDYEFEQVYQELERRGLKRIQAPAPFASTHIHFDKKRPTEYDCYCCNRDEHFEPVIRFLTERQSHNRLHIFLPSHPHDAPESFVTRVSYHLFSDNNFFSPAIRTNAGKGEQVNSMKMVEQTLGLTFRAMEDIEQDIKTYSQPHYPENIALFYRLDLKNWKPDACRSFTNSITGNKFAAGSDKKFRIFYWLDPTGCKSNSGFFSRLFGGGIHPLESLKDACRGQEQIYFLDILPPLQQTDVQSWFSRFCSYHAAYDGFITALFAGRRSLPMADVEPHLIEFFQRQNRYR